MATPTNTDTRTNSGLTRTVLLMTMGFSSRFSIWVYTRKTTAVTIPAVSEWAVANRTVGIPASKPPTSGRKSTRATQSPKASGKGTPRITRVTNMTTPAISEVRQLPVM